MITIRNLRHHHIITAADELDLPLTIKDTSHLANRVAARAASGTHPTVTLTRRKRDVLTGIASGEDHTTTGRRLGVAPATVRTHRQLLYKKLGAENGAHAVAIAVTLGLLRPGGDA